MGPLDGARGGSRAVEEPGRSEGAPVWKLTDPRPRHVMIRLSR